MTDRRQFLKTGALGAVAGAAALPSAAEAAAPRYSFAPEPVHSLPIAGSPARFPVRRIYCMGMNYLTHIAEGGGTGKVPPFFFMKTDDQIVQDGETVRYPLMTKNYHHEIEMVVAIGKDGVNISREAALDHVFGYAVGLDMTRRDLQSQMRDLRQPWEIGKSFDQSAPCAAIHPVSKAGHISKGKIQLSVNGTMRQDADIADLITDVAGCIAYVSSMAELKRGDLIYTGTPAGVGPVVSGDTMVGRIDGLGTLTIKVA